MSISAGTLTSTTTLSDALAESGMQAWIYASNTDMSGVAFLKAVLSNFQDGLDLPLIVGASTAGHDVTFYGTTADTYLLWDKSADKLTTAGKVDVKLLGSTTTYYAEFDASENILQLKGGLDFRADGSVSTNYVMLDASANTLKTYGKLDFIMSGSTSSSYVYYDASANRFMSAGKPDLYFVTSGSTLDNDDGQNRVELDASADVLKILTYIKPSTVVTGSVTPGAYNFGFCMDSSGDIWTKFDSGAGIYRYGQLTSSSVGP